MPASIHSTDSRPSDAQNECRGVKKPGSAGTLSRHGAFQRTTKERLVQHLSGIITVVQEGRFRLATDNGRSVLFSLDHRAPIEPQDLPSLLGRGRVHVAYTTPVGRKGMTAHDVRMEGRE
jgi:hypothetical protein